MAEESSNHPVLFDCNSAFPDSANKLFSNAMIRDIILDYAIHNGNHVNISNVRKLRLVNQSWFQSTHRVLRHSQRSLFNIQWYKEGFIVGKDDMPKTEKLVDFLRSLKGEDTGLMEHVPPHSITTFENVFCQRSHTNSLDYMTHCSSSLTQLKIRFTTRLPVLLPLNAHFLLPRLREFQAIVAKAGKQNSVRLLQHKFDFIQKVLESSERLKVFQLLCTAERSLVPATFGNTRLPSSLTKLEFECALADSSSEILVNSPLPNLETLKICVNYTPFKDGLIHTVLKKVDKTLKCLRVAETYEEGANKSPTFFQLPLMAKLEELAIITPLLQLEGSLSELEKRAPVLKHMTLISETRSFRKWTDQSCFPSVESLNICLVAVDYKNYGLERYYKCNLVNLELSTTEALVRAFPNLVKLDIKFRVTGTELSALVPLMGKLKNLNELKILVQDDGQLGNSDAWDALLLGIPVESVSELRKSPALLEEVQVENGTSIRNLSELHTLELGSSYPHKFPIISEAAFHFAFFKMPKLTTMILTGGFKATAQIRKAWRKEGRYMSSERA